MSNFKKTSERVAKRAEKVKKEGRPEIAERYKELAEDFADIDKICKKMGKKLLSV